MNRSFTQIVKEEIVTKPFDDERVRALLAAYIKINGHYRIFESKEEICMQTENAKIAKYIFKLIVNRYGFSPAVEFKKVMKLNKRVNYTIRIDHKLSEIVDDLCIDFLEEKIPHEVTKTDNGIGGYLAGVFLASGSVNDPNNSNYHLEMITDDENYARWLTKLIVRHKSSFLTPKIIKRRNDFVVYLKKSDQISDFLVLIGAEEACMKFESVRVDRDFSNIGNRLQICDVANLKKTIGTSKKQIEDINLIEEKIGIANLNGEKIQVLCRLRKENEDLSMKELSELMSEELSMEVSKSNVNHLFRKLHEIAEEIRGSKLYDTAND